MMFSWDELARITRGSWRVGPASPGGVSGVVDDSRKCRPGCLFVAVPGERVDGHAFISDAVARGAVAVCVQRDRVDAAAATPRRVPLLAVDDSLSAFQLLAAAWRRRMRKLTVAAVTGSNGKTSVKEMLASILERSAPGAVLSTEGNTNNQFGTPRNLLRLSEEHRYAVIELGTNHPGEIRRLAGVVQPDTGIVTSIGPAHLEFFGDLEGVAREKASLLEMLPADGTAVYPCEGPCSDVLRRAADRRNVITFTVRRPEERMNDAADVVAVYHGRQRDGRRRVDLLLNPVGSRLEVWWKLGGRHQASNAAAAAAAAIALGAPGRAIVEGLRRVRLPAMRMEHRVVDGVHWLNDAYNANAASVRAGVEWFLEESAGAAPADRILVLGDILELGAASEAEHRQVLEWVLKRCPGTTVLTVGPAMGTVARTYGLSNAPDVAALRPILNERLRPGCWVFLKGSRGMHLERLLPTRE